MTLSRQWGGGAPFEEAWFVELLLAPDKGFWLRFRIDATAGQLEIWALATTPEGVVAAEKELFPLGPMDALASCAAARLERDRSVGEIGRIRWDLAFEDRGARHAHLPWWFRALKVGKAYAPGVLDLRVRGEIFVDGRPWRVERGPGIFGHHWGRASRVKRWAWGHCNAFDREDLVFEGLAAKIGRLPTLTSVVFLADGHAYRFSRVRHLARTWSRSDDHSWAFEAREGARVLTGRLSLDPATAATVTYPSGGPGRSQVYCTNTRFGHIRLVLRDPARGLDLDVRSRECAFELVGAEALGTPVL